MKPIPFLTCCISLLVGAASVAAKPNIIFIMADDLAWADVAYNGAEFYETPHIDALRKSGMKFAMSYPGGANCMPSRACIMSGMYTPRTKMYQPGLVAKGDHRLMRLLVPNEHDRVGDGTIESKGQMDPATNTVAKTLKQAGYHTLHLGKWHLGPQSSLGFDRNDLDGRGAGFDQDHLLYGNVDVAEWMTDAAVDYIAATKDDPFFIYLNHWDVHTPINARPQVVAKYQRKLESGQWSRDWDPVYAAMVEAVDTSVQRVWQAVKDHGIAENTLIIFTSDNGGFGGRTWNAPLRGSKGGFYEGGIRVPTVMSWAGTIEPGSVCETPVTGVDYLPTFAELAGVPLPETQPVDGVSIVPLIHGKPIAERPIFWHYPLYLNGKVQVKPIYGTDRLYWRGTPCSIVRVGAWKLMEFFESESLELYNVREDIGEQHNLASQHPAKVTQLLKLLRQWQQETGADIPTTPNPDFDPTFKPNTSPSGG